MSQLVFQAKITLNSAIETSTNVWEFQLSFVDNEGVFTANNISVGDVVIVDTSMYEIGTITRYVVQSITSASASDCTLVAEYDASNDNLSPPDASYSAGTDGVIARPSPNYGLLPVPSPGIQNLPDRFSFYIQNYNNNNIVDNITGGGASPVLNSTTPTPTTIGGISSGTTFDNMPVETVLYNLLYPYQPPAFSSFSISGQTSPLEVGATVTGGSRTFTWVTTNSANIQPNSVVIQNITGGTTTIATGLANDGTEAVTITSVSKNSATSHVWRILASNTNSVQFTRDFTVAWQWRKYHGESTLTTMSEPEIEALRISQLSTAFAGTYSFNAGGYKWIAYPALLGTATTFKDTSTNLDVPFEPVITMAITNAFGVSTTYNIHRTTNILGAAINIAVS